MVEKGPFRLGLETGEKVTNSLQICFLSRDSQALSFRSLTRCPPFDVLVCVQS